MIVFHSRRLAQGRLGLTLIELVLVIAILTVLGGLVVQGLPNMLKRTHLAKCSDTIWSLNNAWSQEFATSVRYPDQYDSLLASGGTTLYGSVPTGLTTQVEPLDLAQPMSMPCARSASRAWSTWPRSRPVQTLPIARHR